MGKLFGKPKTTEAWAVAHYSGGIYVDTISKLRKDSVAEFQALYGRNDNDWRLDVKYGVHAAIKVLIVPITPAGRAILEPNP